MLSWLLAHAGIFVAETTDTLPDGLGFGQLTEGDVFVVFNRGSSDESQLTCALGRAEAVAMATVTVNTSQAIDLTAVSHEVSAIRKLVNQFSKIEGGHARPTRTLPTFALQR